jgi:NhaP-type Na+/H+ or K+/H+ antiporter
VGSIPITRSSLDKPHMSGYGFFSSLRFLFGIAAIVMVGIYTLARTALTHFEGLSQYRNRFGQNWVVEHEKDFESLTTTQTRIAVSTVGILVIISLATWLLRILRRNYHSRNASRRRTKSGSNRFGSRLERNISYRRKALVRIYFGVAGIVAAVALVIFPLGLFADHANQESLGIGVFLVGYCAVIAGCSCWLKAKCLSEGIVFIGFMPLAILLVPFV